MRARQLASEAVELLERLPPGHELAMAYGNVSQRGMAMRDLDRAVAWGTRALALARSLDDNEAVVYSLTNIGTAELQAGLEDGRIEAGTGARDCSDARPRGLRRQSFHEHRLVCNGTAQFCACGRLPRAWP